MNYFVIFSMLLVPAFLFGGVGPIAMTVKDLDVSVPFYRDVLGFKKVDQVEISGSDFEHLMGIFGAKANIVTMQLGEEQIQLIEFVTPKGRPVPLDSRSNDKWFQHIAIIVNDMEKAYSILKEYEVTHASVAPQTLPDWNAKVAGIKAFYFKDPDGHTLEILYFPKDKGNPKWQQQSDNVFLGIDHTAIVVGNTEESLKFYQGLLGMELAGENINYGSEQEYLNNVFGARVRITSLKSNSGPMIELLEYVTPRDGRPLPLNSRLNDLWSWLTRVTNKDIATLEKTLFEKNVHFVSPGIQTLKTDKLPYKKGMVVRDPDGHALLITPEDPS